MNEFIPYKDYKDLLAVLFINYFSGELALHVLSNIVGDILICSVLFFDVLLVIAPLLMWSLNATRPSWSPYTLLPRVD